MNTKYEVLFIDDEHENWMPTLEPVGSRSGIHLLPAATVEEGLSILDRYSAVVDAIVLDLKFTNSSKQGKDALSLIQEKGYQIPVLILTASDSAEDIRTAVECVKLGAFDYFGKSKLDPQQLLLQIQNAIQSKRLRQQHVHLVQKVRRSKTNPAILVEDRGSPVDDALRYRAHFGFLLDKLSFPRNSIEQDAAIDAAIRWHYDFLGSLTFLDTPAHVSIRYIFIPTEGLSVAFLFAVDGPIEKVALEHAETLCAEIEPYIGREFLSATTVYDFQSILDKKTIQQILDPFPAKSLLRVKRKTLDIDSDFFSLQLVSETQVSGNRIPLPCGSPLSRLTSLRRLCPALSEQQEPASVEIIIRPTRLLPVEIDLLREVRNKLGREDINLIQKEKEILAQQTDYLIKQAGQCFEVTVQIAASEDSVPNSLLTAAVNDLFGNISEVRVVNLPSQAQPDIPLVPIARIPDIYPLHYVIDPFHLPLPVFGGMPGIKSTHPLYEFLPPGLPNEGPILGHKQVGQKFYPVRIAPEDLRRHAYILGQTGTGKTTLLYSMIRERLEMGAGFGLIDPHGDLWNEVYTFIPKERRDDVIVFDPTDLSNVPRLNLLEYDSRFPEQKTRLINEMFSFFFQEYHPETMGPMFEQYMRNAMLLVMSDPENPGTVADIFDIFRDAEFRQVFLDKCQDEDVKKFWEQAIRVTGEAGLSNMTVYVTSKLNRLVQDHYLRPIVSQQRSTINFREIIDTRKILLVKLAKGKLGDIGVKLVGSILFARFLMAALSRENVPESQREDFTLFVDEFQNLTSDSIADALSEARKYRLSLVLANQTFGQLKEGILKSVLGNVGSLVFFRPGVEDIQKIEPYVSPPFTREELLNLPNFTAVARLQVNNAPTAPFMFETLPPEVLKR